jgi:PAS domain S-box-containing protein
VSDATQAVLFNAVPLFVLAASYAAVAGAALPMLWRLRGRAHLVDWGAVLVFPAVAAAAGIFGALVVREQRAVGGHVWLSLVAIIVALVPAALLLARWRERGFVAGGIGRTLEAEERVSMRDRELEAVAVLSAQLIRAHDELGIARPLVRQVADLLRVGFAAVTLVSDDGTTANGVYGESDGREAEWWREVAVDLQNETSGIGNAVADAAPVSVYDISVSPLVSRRLAKRVGAKSGAFVPMIAESRVIGVVVAVTTTERRAFTSDELALLQAVAAEAALALERLRSAGALAEALVQQRALLHAAQVVTRELELDTVLRRLVEEVSALLRADAADCYLVDRDRGVLRCAAVHGFDESLLGFEFARKDGDDDIPHPGYHGFANALVAPMVSGGETLGLLRVALRDGDRRFGPGDVELLEAFASLASLALRNAESFEASMRQARIQRGFYRIASLLGEPLSLSESYGAAAEAAADALGADFAAVLARRGDRLAFAGRVPHEVEGLEVPAVLEDISTSGQVLAAPEVAADARFDDAWRRSSVASLLAIPVSPETGGLVLVCFDEQRDFTRDDLELAQQVAAAAHGALERSRLFESERGTRSLSQQLARAAAALAGGLDPEEVLQATADEAAGLLGADAAVVSLIDDGELVAVAGAGGAAADVVGLRAPDALGVSGDVLSSRAPVALGDASADAGHTLADPLLANGLAGYLGVPLTGRDDDLRGVLSVYSAEPRTWRPEEIDALGTLAMNATVAFVNAEVYRHVAGEREQSVAILANIADGIVVVDRDGLVVLWNAAAEDITGVPATEAVGKTLLRVLQRDLESDRGGTTRLVSIPRSGEEVWLALSEAVMRDSSGAVAGRIFAFRDISAEFAVEQMKSDFVSSVSLELRAPLTSIYGFAQTLLRDDVVFGDEERRTFLDFIASEAERLSGTVDALLSVAQLETGDLTVSLEPTDVAAVVSKLVETAAGSPGNNGHRFVADVSSELPLARADPVKLHDVLDQLVSNAVKFSPEGGTVTVSARQLEDAIELAVTDEGEGIPASEQERIFAKFAKAGAGQGRGTGLGLFIAQGLVREMGGRIRVDSEQGRGSRFAFDLAQVRE